MTSCLPALGGYRRAWNVDFFLMAMSEASDWRGLGRFVVHAQVFGVPFHMGRVALLPVSAYACGHSGGSVQKVRVCVYVCVYVCVCVCVCVCACVCPCIHVHNKRLP